MHCLGHTYTKIVFSFSERRINPCPLQPYKLIEGKRGSLSSKVQGVDCRLIWIQEVKHQGFSLTLLALLLPHQLDSSLPLLLWPHPPTFISSRKESVCPEPSWRLGHGLIPEPVMVVRGIPCADWLSPWSRDVISCSLSLCPTSSPAPIPSPPFYLYIKTFYYYFNT